MELEDYCSYKTLLRHSAFNLYLFLFYFSVSSFSHGHMGMPGIKDETFLNQLLNKREESDIPQNIIVEQRDTRAILNCKTSPGVNRIIWRIEMINERKFIAVIAENGRVSGGWKKSHAINASTPSQNTLIIKDLSMMNAGKYSCKLHYQHKVANIFDAEVIIVRFESTPGNILMPSGYYKWVLRYNGNLKPFFRCSNGQVLNGVAIEKTKNDSTELVFNGCFEENMPTECTLMTADYLNNRFAVYKTFNMTQNNVYSNFSGLRDFDEHVELVTFEQSQDRIISLKDMSLEFKCDFVPTPDLFLWVFTSPDRSCIIFENNIEMSKSRLPFRHYVVSPTATSSHLIIFHFGSSAAGKYTCIGNYWTQNLLVKRVSAELNVVTRHEDIVRMFEHPEVPNQYDIRFELTYRGNLKPFLQCFSIKLEVSKSVYHYHDIHVSGQSDLI